MNKRQKLGFGQKMKREMLIANAQTHSIYLTLYNWGRMSYANIRLPIL